LASAQEAVAHEASAQEASAQLASAQEALAHEAAAQLASAQEASAHEASFFATFAQLAASKTGPEAPVESATRKRSRAAFGFGALERLLAAARLISPTPAESGATELETGRAVCISAPFT